MLSSPVLTDVYIFKLFNVRDIRKLKEYKNIIMHDSNILLFHASAIGKE